MKKVLLPALIIIVLFGTAFFLKKLLSRPKAEATVGTLPTEKIRPEIKPKSDTPTTAAAAPQQEENYDPESKLIPFEVVNGLAIAFGDIILGTPENPEVTKGFFDAPHPKLWDKPEIPFAISDDLPDPERVRTALRYFEENTPVSFVPYESQTDAVVFSPGEDNCYSLLGREGGLQPIKLAPQCQWGQIVHEIMHSLGFVHEQSRPDRDDYLDILWSNIDPLRKNQFKKVPAAFMAAQKDSAFDYQSALLYSPEMFSKEKGLPTMESKTDVTIRPMHNGLSRSDIERLYKLYPSAKRKD